MNSAPPLPGNHRAAATDEKSTVTIQRGPASSLSLSLPFFSLRFTSRFPVYRQHVTSEQGWDSRMVAAAEAAVADAFIDSFIALISRRREPFSDKKPTTRSE